MNDLKAKWEFLRLWRMRFSGVFLIAGICLVVMALLLPANTTIMMVFLVIVFGTLFISLVLAITFGLLERAARKRMP